MHSSFDASISSKEVCPVILLNVLIIYTCISMGRKLNFTTKLSSLNAINIE